MKKELVEIYSDASNFAVIRHPGRNYPGCLIQGDSLYSLLCSLEEVSEELGNGNIGDAKESLESIRGLLADRIEHYEAVLKEHGIGLPYVRYTA